MQRVPMILSENKISLPPVTRRKEKGRRAMPVTNRGGPGGSGGVLKDRKSIYRLVDIIDHLFDDIIESGF